MKNSLKIKNSKLKIFISDFYLSKNPWENLPSGFPYCDTRALNKEEKHLLGAIITAWIVSHPKNYFVPKLTYTTYTLASGFVFITVLTMLLYYLNVEFHLGLTFLTDFFA